MSEIRLRPVPKLEVRAQPGGAIDARTKRLVDKELRAAWGEKQARWQSSTDLAQGSAPTVYLSCRDAPSATAIALQVRIGLTHLVVGIRRQLPQWVIHFSAEGNDGLLQLEWGLDFGPDEIAQSLLGPVPKPGAVHGSEGRRFWDERDGGISLLGPGIWAWDTNTQRWQTLNG